MFPFMLLHGDFLADLFSFVEAVLFDPCAVFEKWLYANSNADAWLESLTWIHFINNLQEFAFIGLSLVVSSSSKYSILSLTVFLYRF